ncbi:hypothetical protein FSP39_000786 [Pinctada imbricata]|uniref:Protein SMG9 n=1 Tax=Pinctada imbricata TaxID=66713 RepID=A0AA88XEA5_PINIB|nr:hypothetical protein FSP39_000786 [Pinctada imbricata]
MIAIIKVLVTPVISDENEVTDSVSSRPEQASVSDKEVKDISLQVTRILMAVLFQLLAIPLLERDYEAETPPAKPPTILVKPSSEQRPGPTYSSPGPQVSPTRTTDRPVVIARSRDDGQPTTPSGAYGGTPSIVTREGTTVPRQTLQRHTANLPQPETIQSRLAPPPIMKQCIKLIDEHQNWTDTALEYLTDSTEFVVVGVIGLQGTGKSTIISQLAGNTPTDHHRKYVFPTQARDVREICEHQTTGVDMFISSERLIFIDSQPVISPSVLDKMIRADRKIPPEYSTAENCIEMQSLHQVAFLMTVCHVILVVQDWFTDMNLLRFLQTAEMLKPASHSSSSSHDGASGPEENSDYFPHLVFVQNKATRDMFTIETFDWMQTTIAKVFDSSKLKIKGDVTLATGKLLPSLSRKTLSSDVNLYLLPTMDKESTDPDSSDMTMNVLPEFKGHPPYTTLINGLRKQVYYMPRDPLTHTNLTEKNWFNYAARTWDAVKKSPLMAEYNRLLH